MLMIYLFSSSLFREQEEGEKVKGRIPLRVILSVERQQPADKKRPHSIIVSTAGRDYVIDCESEEGAATWVRVIESGVQSSQALTVSSFVFQSLPSGLSAGGVNGGVNGNHQNEGKGDPSRPDSVIVGGAAALASVAKTVDMNNPVVRKILLETVPSLLKETRASCAKILATLLANNLAHF